MLAATKVLVRHHKPAIIRRTNDAKEQGDRRHKRKLDPKPSRRPSVGERCRTKATKGKGWMALETDEPFSTVEMTLKGGM
ncbi:unnamed protein product [Nippostrongylus brasiliensis]|uniref:Uncharacterized protein n=1 Tax=Nippostrongylus brasiliensis TaxID=27835 RepID=A0A0N4XII8_NIPBR|nr:unnamed protein product [Nippostrongylus brasiliensis]